MALPHEVELALDEARALPLALIEVLSEKYAPGSFQRLLSQDDVKKILERQGALMGRFHKERLERARGLILPPGSV